MFRTLPNSILTPDDWIAEIRPRDRKRRPFRIGVSWRLSEDDARRHVDYILAWRKVGVSFVTMRRRYQWRNGIAGMHPENAMRFDKKGSER